MAIVKSYTDLPQSERLSKILSHESADMYYDLWDENDINVMDEHFNPRLDCRAWSLTALLGVLPSATLDSSDNHRYRLRCNERFTEWYDNAIDACVEMIEKLHKQKLL